MIKQQLFSIGTVAKMTDFPGGQKRMFIWLRDNGYLQRNNEPYQRFIDNGWMVLLESKIYHEDPPRIVPVPKVTIKGLAGLKRVIDEQFPVCAPC